MRIDPDTYRAAAAEHVSLARELYQSERYVYAIYVAGVSVECLLRSQVPGEELHTGHDLWALLRESRLLQSLTDERASEVAAALGAVWARWRNTHRYRSLLGLKRFLVDHGLHRGVRGDPVKEAARIAVESALTIIGRGIKR